MRKYKEPKESGKGYIFLNENITKRLKIIKRNKKRNSRVENTGAQQKYPLKGLNSRLKQEERISDTEDIM